jgi:hypothetical protein
LSRRRGTVMRTAICESFDYNGTIGETCFVRNWSQAHFQLPTNRRRSLFGNVERNAEMVFATDRRWAHLTVYRRYARVVILLRQKPEGEMKAVRRM